MKKLIIAGIGSRETPPEILDEMTKIGEWIRNNHHTLRSGHAAGADWAFEQGAQDRCIVYLPWSSFHSEFISNSIKVVVSDQANYDSITNDYHPHAYRLSSGARKLMNRNICQVLGLDLQKPSNLIICWTKDGLDIGGTSQALRIARNFNIPIYNMYYPEYNTAEKILKVISQNFLD